jgi:DNA-binding beta-propeller fold protein YncE
MPASVCLLLLVLGYATSSPAAKLRQVAMIDLPGNPGFHQVTMAAGEVVITRPETNTIEIFSPVKRRIIARISQIDNPRGIAVDDAGSRIYVALAGSNRIAVISSKNWQTEQLIPVQHMPEKLLWVPETKLLYVTSVHDRTVSVVDPRIAGETAVIEMNALPQDLLYDSSRGQILISLQDQNEIAALDGANKVSRLFRLAASEPTSLALENTSRRLYVAVRYAVLALNADTGAELFRIPAPGGTDSLILDSANHLLYAAGGDGSVLAIDLTRNTVDHELPTDVKGFSIAYDPVRKMLFLPGGREGRAKMVILSPVGLQPEEPKAAQNPEPPSQTAMKK